MRPPPKPHPRPAVPRQPHALGGGPAGAGAGRPLPLHSVSPAGRAAAGGAALSAGAGGGAGGWGRSRAGPLRWGRLGGGGQQICAASRGQPDRRHQTSGGESNGRTRNRSKMVIWRKISENDIALHKSYPPKNFSSAAPAPRFEFIAQNPSEMPGKEWVHKTTTNTSNHEQFGAA